MRNAVGAVQSLLVLGGTSEIALATVRRLAADRLTRVVLAGRDPAALQAAGAALSGVSVAVERWDALDEPAAAVERILDAHGDLDAVLLAAGVLDDEDVARLLATNFTGPAAALAVCARRMREAGHGTIVVLSSVAAQRPRRSNYAYGASKAGLDGFAQGLADDLAGTGVQVLVVRPGFVHTKMTAGMRPAPLATTPERVAEAIADGLRRGRHTVWAPPPVRLVMVVLGLLPRAVFRRLAV